MRKQFEELHPLFDLEKDEQGEYTCVLTRVTWLGFELGKKTLQAEIDQLEAQLNNMEQCYIGMKKERDALQARIENVNQSLGEMVAVSENLHSSWYVLHDAADLCKAEGIDQCVSEINKALRGER